MLNLSPFSIEVDKHPFLLSSWPQIPSTGALGMEVLHRDGFRCQFCNLQPDKDTQTYESRYGTGWDYASGEGIAPLLGWNSLFMQVAILDGDKKNLELDNLKTCCAFCQMSFMPLSAVKEGMASVILMNTLPQSVLNHLLWKVYAVKSIPGHRYTNAARLISEGLLVGDKHGAKRPSRVEEQPAASGSSFKTKAQIRQESAKKKQVQGPPELSQRALQFFDRFPFLRDKIKDTWGNYPFVSVLTVLQHLQKDYPDLVDEVLPMFRIVPSEESCAAAVVLYAKTIFSSQEGVSTWPELTLKQ